MTNGFEINKCVRPTALTARAIQRLFGDETAMAAVEFAFIAPLFFSIILLTLMTGVIYMARSQLDAAAQVAARAVMVNNQNMSASTLQGVICGQGGQPGAVGGIFNCNSIMVNVNSYSSFAAANSANATSTPTITYNSSGAVSNKWGSNYGTPGSIMVLQLLYQFPMIGTSLFNLATQANGTDLLISTAVFIDE